MFKKIMSTILATIMSLSIISAVPVSAATETNYPHYPTKQAATAFVGDLGGFRRTARRVVRETETEYDILEIGVVMNSYGDTIIFPDAAGDGVPSYACVHIPVKRGQVVALTETLDGYGEVDNIDYFVIEKGNYSRTDELSIQFKAAWDEWANYAKRRATETKVR